MRYENLAEKATTKFHMKTKNEKNLACVSFYIYHYCTYVGSRCLGEMNVTRIGLLVLETHRLRFADIPSNMLIFNVWFNSFRLFIVP